MAAPMGDGGDLVMLMEVSQLKKLALLLRNNEEAQITQAVKSQNERVKYLHSVNHAYNHAVDLLDDGSATRDNMQNVRNCCLRVDCIGKIRAHYDSLVADLAGLHADDVANLRRLAKDTAMFKECMFEHCNRLRSGSARAMSKAFSMMLKQEGIKFPDLVKRRHPCPLPVLIAGCDEDLGSADAEVCLNRSSGGIDLDGNVDWATSSAADRAHINAAPL
ncbi:hypothetical protein OsJ_14231 [Oryza sativa Japonica Group]|uniref:Uncharacterized protein n=1 Tax=Oryza sativa subsp. japonica TaxID=39947 RepID=B9FED8_ORYSJ|nr:hypothetical protein OsJ_14231 [Oryza sativa Japonica Group]